MVRDTRARYAHTIRYCTDCGQPNPSHARFCAVCGRALVQLSTETVFQGPPIINNNIITLPAPASVARAVVMMDSREASPSLLTRGCYFLLIGCWLGALCTALAWTLNMTIIGLPLGLLILNRLPQIMTLAPIMKTRSVTVCGARIIIQQSGLPQYRFVARAFYFIFVGWWFSALWLLMAWSLLAMTMGLALPMGFWMFNCAPAVTTLER